MQPEAQLPGGIQAAHQQARSTACAEQRMIAGCRGRSALHCAAQPELGSNTVRDRISHFDAHERTASHPGASAFAKQDGSGGDADPRLRRRSRQRQREHHHRLNLRA